jgi:release factor glutamine methyltransferase
MSKIVNRKSSIELICSNLPYIPTTKLQGLPIYNREPRLALDGGVDGLNQIRRLMKVAPEWLARDGMMLLEIEATQGLQVISLARETFANAQINLHKDMAGKDRLLEIALPLAGN